MSQSLKEFKEEFRELILTFLWRQWTALGVAGSGRIGDDWIIDPEALLIFTCTMGRHEPRLFDEVVDWLTRNGDLINTQRLSRILKTETFSGRRALSAIASHLRRGKNALKWKRLARDAPNPETLEPYFFLSNGKPLPVMRENDAHFSAYGYARAPLNLRGYSMRSKPTETTNLVLQLRALYGVNARSEILAYLLTHENAHPSKVAQDTCYAQRTVQDAMVEMAASAVVRVKTSGREKRYWVKQESWEELLDRKNRMPDWITWPPLFSALEQIWLKLQTETDDKDRLLLASNMRQLMSRIKPMVDRTAFSKFFSDDQLHHGEEYLDVFMSDIKNLLESGLNENV